LEKELAQDLEEDAEEKFRQLRSEVGLGVKRARFLESGSEGLDLVSKVRREVEPFVRAR
jgi:hypothetical protein